MAFIAPLKGVHFNPQKVGKLDEVVTPPYDVISAHGVDSYLARNPYNMIRLDIVKSHGPGDETNARYQEAADLFKQWLEERCWCVILSQGYISIIPNIHIPPEKD